MRGGIDSLVQKFLRELATGVSYNVALPTELPRPQGARAGLEPATHGLTAEVTPVCTAQKYLSFVIR